MKSLKISAILFVLLLGAFGCEEALIEEPQSQISPESFFNNAQDAEGTLFGAYDALQSGNYYGRYIFAASLHAGAISYSRSGSRTPIALYTDNQILNQSRSNRRLWPGFYEGIKRANTVLKFVPEIDMDTNLREEILGEAYFLRGMHYLNLVRFFGSAPIVNELAEGANIEDFLFEKSSVAELYAQTISDFENAISRLDTRAEKGADRGNREAAQGMLMRTYWSRAVSEATEANDWQMAKTLGEDILSSFVLEPDFAELFGGESSRRDLNPETLFEVSNTRTTGESQGSAVHNTVAPEFSGIGGGAWGTAHARIPHWNTFEDGDARKTVTFLTEYTEDDGNIVPWWKYVAAQAPHFKKYIDFEQEISNSPFNVPVIRGADILLMLAEIENQLNGGPNATAYNYIDQVRARAGIGLLAGSGLGQEQFRDSVLFERRRELVGEGHDYPDAAHFGGDKLEWLANITGYTNDTAGRDEMIADIPTDDLAAIMAEPNAEEILDGIFGRQLKVEDIEWGAHNIRFAIPQSAVDTNPKLGENDPYR